MKEDACLQIGGKEFSSRLMVGTGKYSSSEIMMESLSNAESSIVTVAVRRIQKDYISDNLLEKIDWNKFWMLPNTAGCYKAEDAVRTCEIAEELLNGEKLIKLEVLSQRKTLFPNIVETIKAAEILVKKDFKVMVYTTDDPIVAKELENIGCECVMPLGSAIGSGIGIINEYNIREIIEKYNIYPLKT